MTFVLRTLLDFLRLLARRPLGLLWSLLLGLLTGLSGGLLLASAGAALQRYFLGGLQGQGRAGFDLRSVLTLSHFQLSLIYAAFSLFSLLFLAGMPEVMLMLFNTFLLLLFLYAFLEAGPDVPAFVAMQRSFALVRKGDLWKHVALIFLFVFVQVQAGERIPFPELTQAQLLKPTQEEALALVQAFLWLGVLSWISFFVGSAVVASWYRQLTSEPDPKLGL